MGHRALVAYRRPDRLYDLRYSHWGGETVALADEITATTPLADGAIEGALIADSISRARILTAYLDPCVYEALYLVTPSRNYDVDAYRVCWLEWGDGRDGGRGAIVAVDSEEDGTVRRWFRATKTALGDIIEMGALSRRAAQAYLEARVCEERDGIPYTYGESLDDGESTYTPTADRWLEAERRESEDRTDGGGERGE
ncbi:DUF6735 family protein [Natrinema longum]|uniref:Uncharacterized protein n=1 Tax=Natrinema longum TaxID=370324 RepID=A0A8A2U9H3_9EURY|nr:DUF6735 family protein [Natrinema longum]MBZ6493409.1 hypothetical protein [Natrinema longum]QSW85243.1 hypothetical protein J0X27_17655 [Natrinema longum]